MVGVLGAGSFRCIAVPRGDLTYQEGKGEVSAFVTFRSS